MIMDDTVGFYLHNVSNISIKDCQLTWGENRPTYYNDGLKIVNCESVKIKDYDYLPSKDIASIAPKPNQIIS